MRVIYIVVFVTLVWLYVCWSGYWAYHEDPTVVTRTISTASTSAATAITDAESDAAGAAMHGASAGRLDPAVLMRLPAFVYSAAAQGERLECAVCLVEFGDEEKGRTLPSCGHSFHKDCIDVWFGAHSTCPICRAPVELHGGSLEGSEFNV